MSSTPHPAQAADVCEELHVSRSTFATGAQRARLTASLHARFVQLIPPDVMVPVAPSDHEAVYLVSSPAVAARMASASTRVHLKSVVVSSSWWAALAMALVS